MRSTIKEKYMSRALRHLINIFRPENGEKYDIVRNEVMIGSRDRYKITIRKHKSNSYYAQSSFIYETFNDGLYKKAIALHDSGEIILPSDPLYGYFVRDPLLTENVYRVLKDLDEIEESEKITLDKFKVPRQLVAL